MDRNELVQALPVSQITLRLTTASLEMLPDAVDGIHIMVSGADNDVKALRIEQEGSQLLIEQPAAAFAKAATSASWLQITIRTPVAWKGSISARTVSGRIALRDMSGADLTMESVSGMITGSGMQFLTVTARSITGDVKLDSTRCEKCTMTSTTGSLSFAQGSLLNATAATVTGMITLSLTESFAELSLNSVSGDLCVDAPVAVCDALLRSASGRVRTSGVSIGEAPAKIRAATVSSDLDIARSDIPE